jgi:hypothetical protein
MPTAKANSNGTYSIRRDDGITYTSPVLPSGVALEGDTPTGPAPGDNEVLVGQEDGSFSPVPLTDRVRSGKEDTDPPAGRHRVLLPRGDGLFDAVTVENWGGQVGHSAGVVSAPTAIKMRDEGGFQVMGEQALAELADSQPELFRAMKAARNSGARPGPQPGPSTASKLKSGLAAVAERLTAPWNPETYKQGSPTPATAGAPAAGQPSGQSLESFFQAPPGQPAAPAAPALQASGSVAAAPVPSFRPAGAGQAMRELQKAKDMQAEAVTAAASVAQQRAAAEEAVVDTQLSAAREREIQAQQREERKTRGMDEAETTVRQAMAQLTTPTGELDPNRWWNTRTTGGKVSAFVASFLSGFIGRADPIQQAIDQDIALQREGYERQRGAAKDQLAAATQLYGLMRERFNDDELAARASEERAAAYAVLEGRKVAARFAAPEAKAMAAERLATLETWHAEKRNALREAAANRALQAYEIETRRRGQDMDFALQAGKAGAKGNGPTIPAGEAAQVASYDAALQQLDNLAKQHGVKTGGMSWLTQHLPGTDASKYDDLRRVAAQGIGYILEGGKLTESDLVRYMEMLPSPTDGLERAQNKVEALRRDIAGRKGSKLEGLDRAGYNVTGFRDEMPVRSGRAQ